MKKLNFSILVCAILGASAIQAAELAEIQARKEVKIGVRMSLYPFSKQNEDGSFEGFEVEFAKKLGNAILKDGGNVILVGVNAKQRIEKLQNGEIDIAVASLAKSPDREKLIDFSTPYFSYSDAVLTHKDNKISSLKDMKDEKILAVPGTTSYKFLNEQNFDVIDCKNAPDCFERLKAGEAKFYAQMNTQIAAFPLVDDNYIMGLRKLGSDHFISVGVPKNTPILKQFINDQIVKFSKDGMFKKAYDDVFEPYYRGTLDRKYFLLDGIYDMLF